MKQYRVSFDVSYPFSSVVIDANSAEEAEDKFNAMCWGEIEELSGDFPDAEDIEIDDITLEE